VAPESQVCASDLSPAAVALTRRNSDRLGADVEVRCGSLFEPWQGRRFDLIVDDVSALAESIARSSPWYPPPVPSEAGEDGTRWIRAVLERAPGFLSEGGRLIFPVLTLAHQERTLEAAAASFRTLRPLAEEWYPLGPELAARPDLLEALAERGIVEIRSRGSRRLWATRVYLAADPHA
jgi:release factor glutamine methyltransferase